MDGLTDEEVILLIMAVMNGLYLLIKFLTWPKVLEGRDRKPIPGSTESRLLELEWKARTQNLSLKENHKRINNALSRIEDLEKKQPGNIYRPDDLR